MRIAVVHSYYSSDQPSGENRSVDAEVDALQRAGYEVELFAAYTDASEGDILYPVRAAFRVATGYGRSPSDAIRRWKPDLVHIHNLFPNFGRRWTANLDVPLVHTLRNYRPICSNGLLFRDGQVCTLCPDGHRISSLRFACYRDSRLATLPLTVATAGGPMRDPLLRHSDRLVVLSELQRDVYLASGVPEELLYVSPNFLPRDMDPGPATDPGTYFAAVGRLSTEKGFARLARTWPKDRQLRIAGEGPGRRELESIANPGVELLGLISHDCVMDLVRSARALVFPSLWYETFGRTAMEALACGTPILATPGNTVAKMVESHGGGMVASWQDLPDALNDLRVDSDARAAARAVFDSQYTETAFARRMSSLYSELSESVGLA